MWWRMANLGQLHVLRNWSSLLRLITPFTCCTMRRINYVFGSLVNINWTSSRSGIHTFPLRARLTKSTLDPKNTITLTGWVSIIQQGGGISPGSSSWIRRQLALLRETPLPYVCSHGWGFDWNQRWRSLLGHHAPSLNRGWGEGQRTSRIGQNAFGSGHSLCFRRGTARSPHWVDQCAQFEASPWGVVCPFPPILAEAHFA